MFILYLSVLAMCKFDVSAMWLCRYWFKSPYSPFSNTIHMGSSSRLAPSSRATFRSASRTSLFASCWNSILEDEVFQVGNIFIDVRARAILLEPWVLNMCAYVSVTLKVMQIFLVLFTCFSRVCHLARKKECEKKRKREGKEDTY